MATTTKPRYKVIGTRPIRHDGVDKVTGRAKYGADIKLTGMLYGAMLRSPHAHAKIKRIDTSKAEALPGVRAVVTAESDVIRPEDVRRLAEPDLKRRMAEAIEALPEGYRTVFVMHDVEGYTHEEIGAALGVQSGTSKAQLFRARARLREALADFAGEWIA